MKLYIETEKCKSCQMCIYYCPKKVLKLEKKLNKAGYHSVELSDEKNCNLCGICYIVCPDYCIEIK